MIRPLLLSALSGLVLAACQQEPQVEAPAAEDAASEASASTADVAGGTEASRAGTAPATETDGGPIGAPPPINGMSGEPPPEAGGSVRPELGSRPPEDPTTETLVRPDTPMPDTTPDGRPGF